MELKLKSRVASDKRTLCLSEIIESHNLLSREAEKLERYCRIEIKTERTTLTAKDIELHAWAAGVIPEKISGGPVVIERLTTSAAPTPEIVPTQKKLRRGDKIMLVLKSEHMTIARQAVLLADGFPGESVELRPDGTRKTLRARLNADGTAELKP